MEAAVAGWIGSTNLGDELIFAALKAKLRARGVEPVPISVDPHATFRTHGTRSIGALDVARQWRAAGRVESLLFGGGGLLQDETSPLNLPYHLGRTLPYRLRRRNVGLVGLGVGALTTGLGRRVVRAGVLPSWPVSVRDAASADLLASVGLPRPILAADLVFSMDPPEVERRDEVVVSLRPQVARGRVLPASMRWTKGMIDDGWITQLADRLDAVCDATGLAAHLVAFQGDRDGPLHEAVATRMRHPVQLTTPTLDTVLDVVGGARLVIGMRFHACVVATLAGVPSVALTYSDKVRALADELGAGGVAMPVTPEALSTMAADAARIVDGGEDVEAARARLREREQGNDRVIDAVLERATA